MGILWWIWAHPSWLWIRRKCKVRLLERRRNVFENLTESSCAQRSNLEMMTSWMNENLHAHKRGETPWISRQVITGLRAHPQQEHTRTREAKQDLVVLFLRKSLKSCKWQWSPRVCYFNACVHTKMQGSNAQCELSVCLIVCVYGWHIMVTAPNGLNYDTNRQELGFSDSSFI